MIRDTQNINITKKFSACEVKLKNTPSNQKTEL